MTSETELAWAAGLFAGEGCVSIQRGKRLWNPTLALGMYDERAVRRFAVAVASARPMKVAKVANRVRPGVQNAGFTYIVRVGGQGVKSVVSLLAPYLEDSDKYDQAIRVFAEVEDHNLRTGAAQSESWARRLDWETVVEMRRLFEEERWPQVQIAKHFGVSQPLVSSVVRYLSWTPRD